MIDFLNHSLCGLYVKGYVMGYVMGQQDLNRVRV